MIVENDGTIRYENPHQDADRARRASVLLGADADNHRSRPAWAEVIAAAKRMGLPGSEYWQNVHPRCIFRRLPINDQITLFEGIAAMPYESLGSYRQARNPSLGDRAEKGQEISDMSFQIAELLRQKRETIRK
ncbi:hypothetical protein FACS189491_11440 [Spirochaetia bacterium]|nr:hypothetical protein FACS189491_11440 [Spirochaetia bacterium]